MTIYGEIESSAAVEVMVGNLSRNVRVGSIASSLILVRTGVVLTDYEISHITNELAELRERWHVSPDDVMEALSRNEPMLKQEWLF